MVVRERRPDAVLDEYTHQDKVETSTLEKR